MLYISTISAYNRFLLHLVIYVWALNRLVHWSVSTYKYYLLLKVYCWYLVENNAVPLSFVLYIRLLKLWHLESVSYFTSHLTWRKKMELCWSLPAVTARPPRPGQMCQKFRPADKINRNFGPMLNFFGVCEYFWISIKVDKCWNIDREIYHVRYILVRLTHLSFLHSVHQKDIDDLIL